MVYGSPFCSNSYPHDPDKHQRFLLSHFNFIRNVTFNDSLISQCNIRLEITVVIVDEFYEKQESNKNALQFCNIL